MPQTDTSAFIPFFFSFTFLFIVIFGLTYWWFIKFWTFDSTLFFLDYLKVSCQKFLKFTSSSKQVSTSIFKSAILLISTTFSYDPLAQFFLEIVAFPTIIHESSLFKVIITVTATALISWVAVFLFYYVFSLNSFSYVCGTPVFFQISGLFSTVRMITKENLSVFATRYNAVLDTIFFSILFFNFLGLIPYSFTITSQLSFTLFLSTAFFIGINIIGIRAKGFEIFNLFLPSGVPLFISPFLVLIEVISYFARLFSLGIRLFANMMAGHALTIILSGYAWLFLLSDFSVGVISFFIVYCVIGLEFMVAFLQAYVFTMLISIYINDVLSGH